MLGLTAGQWQRHQAPVPVGRGSCARLRRKGSGASPSSAFMERELTLDGDSVSAIFHDSMDMGVVGTTAGTLWCVSLG